MKLEEIKVQIQRMNGSPFNENDINDQAALVLLSATQIGTGVRKLTTFTELPFKTVSTFVRRLRCNGVFVGRKIHADWFDKDGGISFCLDVLVATGMMARAR